VVFRGSKLGEEDVVIKVALADSTPALEQLCNEQHMLEKLNSGQPQWAKCLPFCFPDISTIGDYIGRPISQLVAGTGPKRDTASLVVSPLQHVLLELEYLKARIDKIHKDLKAMEQREEKEHKFVLSIIKQIAAPAALVGGIETGATTFPTAVADLNAVVPAGTHSISAPVNVVAVVTRPVGRSLIQFLAFNRERFPPSSEARRMLLNDWLVQLSEAVLFLHSHNVIHRDIKPSNMILVGDRAQSERVQLIDLGLAWSTDQKIPEPAGTFHFASANVLEEGIPTFRDDWISLMLSIYALYIGMERYELELRPTTDSILALFPYLATYITS